MNFSLRKIHKKWSEILLIANIFIESFKTLHSLFSKAQVGYVIFKLFEKKCFLKTSAYMHNFKLDFTHTKWIQKYYETKIGKIAHCASTK